MCLQSITNTDVQKKSLPDAPPRRSPSLQTVGNGDSQQKTGMGRCVSFLFPSDWWSWRQSANLLIFIIALFICFVAKAGSDSHNPTVQVFTYDQIEINHVYTYKIFGYDEVEYKHSYDQILYSRFTPYWTEDGRKEYKLAIVDYKVLSKFQPKINNFPFIPTFNHQTGYYEAHQRGSFGTHRIQRSISLEITHTTYDPWFVRSSDCPPFKRLPIRYRIPIEQ